MAYVPESGSVAAFIKSSNGSVIAVPQGSIAAAIVSGSIAATFTPPANQSVSGTVGASIIGHAPVVITGGSVAVATGNSSVQVLNFPANQSVSGTLGSSIIGWVPIQASNSSIITVAQGSVGAVIVGGSIAASFTPPANQSVSGTIDVGNFPTNQNVSGSVVAFQGAGWSGSVATRLTTSTDASVITVSRSSVAVAIVSGSIAASFTPPANQSVSGTVEVGNFPTTQNVSGSVAAWLQSTNASVITVGTAAPNQSVSGTIGASVIGTVPVTQVTTPWAVTNVGSIISLNVGSVITVPSGTQTITGTVTANQGTGFGSIASHIKSGSVIAVLGGNTSVVQANPQSSIIVLSAPYASLIQGRADLRVVQGASVAVLAAPGASIRNYVTAVQVANYGPSSVLVTIADNTTSILGYTIAPAGGGSNFNPAYRAAVNSPVTASINGVASVLVSMQGFTA